MEQACQTKCSCRIFSLDKHLRLKCTPSDRCVCFCRTVLVDDTPLAFLHQPENGVPVLGFRGDPDDRLLMEAVLPLIQVSHR